MHEITIDTPTVKTPHSRKNPSAAKGARMLVQAILNLALMIWVVRDIRRRSDDEIKGNRKLWMMAAFAPPIGPIAYIVFGRKPSDTE